MPLLLSSPPSSPPSATPSLAGGGHRPRRRCRHRKTATLVVLGHGLVHAFRAHGVRGLYLAYNKAMAVDAVRRFPRHIQCSTTHALAYHWTGQLWGHSALANRLSAPRLTPRESQQRLGVNSPARVNTDLMLAPRQIVSLAQETVRRFNYSDDDDLKRWHVPRKPGIATDADQDVVVQIVLPVAQRLWADLSKPTGGCRFTHDHYLKLWALTHPQLDADVVFLDESQDTNPVVAGVFTRQEGKHLIAVGDACQAIYGWRGAEDFVSAFAARPGVKHLFLTQSWRFGPEVADWANMCLGLLDAELRLTGNPNLDTRVGPFTGQPDAILCRTNACAIEEVIACHTAGIPVAMAGSAGAEMKRLAEACMELRERGFTGHPELSFFTSWGQVQDYVDQCPEGEMAVAVRLIDEHDPETIIDAINQCTDPRRAVTTVSTAHGSKGREWDKVRIANDWKNPRDEHGELLPLADEELRLAYVALTRGRLALNPGVLGQIISERATPAVLTR